MPPRGESTPIHPAIHWSSSVRGLPFIQIQHFDLVDAKWLLQTRGVLPRNLARSTNEALGLDIGLVTFWLHWRQWRFNDVKKQGR
jgi:hypothetical protein|tara:strand:+ start:163 stop:417 length:255 start_codon:yes stop_codon:yes gene_type:complete